MFSQNHCSPATDEIPCGWSRSGMKGGEKKRQRESRDIRRHIGRIIKKRRRKSRGMVEGWGRGRRSSRSDGTQECSSCPTHSHSLSRWNSLLHSSADSNHERGAQSEWVCSRYMSHICRFCFSCRSSKPSSYLSVGFLFPPPYRNRDSSYKYNPEA